MCAINCSGGCPECAPDDHLKDAINYLRAFVDLTVPDELLHSKEYLLLQYNVQQFLKVQR